MPTPSPVYPDPATTSGTSYVGGRPLVGGLVIPYQIDKLIRPLSFPASSRQRAPSMVQNSPPATLSSIEAKVPGSTYTAEIVKPLAIVPSVAGTLYNATPVSNVTAIATDLRSGVRGRPLIPPGLRGRAADAMPPGIRQRATVWARAVARYRSNRPTSGGRVHRE